MIFPKDFKKCAIMSQECPNCKQFTNASFSRLVKDSCGHTKCRMCLLYEEHGCKICQAECLTQSVQDYSKETCSINKDPSQTDKPSSEELVFPLELVINKDSKFKDSHSDSISIECRSPDLHDDENASFDDNETYQSQAINDTDINNAPDKLSIPTIEACNFVRNIRNHLRNEDDHDSVSLRNLHDNQVEKKIDEVVVEKNVKRRDRSHITIVPGNPEKYKCNVCGKIFRNKKGKCYHDACVTGIRPYQCTYCDRSFVKRSHFEYHERMHKGYKPYKCNLCEKAFPQQNKLNRHMFSHSKEKQFACRKCNKRYSKRDDLKIHLNVHNATTMYNCKSCDKSFQMLTNLKRHMRTHIIRRSGRDFLDTQETKSNELIDIIVTGERSHACDQCNKSFKDRSLLIRHKRIHGKERPFSCADCNKVFLSKSELRRHLTVHLDEKPFSCEYCQTLFRRKDNLNRHIRHHHTEDLNCETRKTAIAETDSRSSSAKSGQQRQRQKPKAPPKKTQARSPDKVATISASSRDPISSRLDLMGNITPVIRTTSEVSNAVPVINGPIRRPEDRTDQKMFTHIEPIPIAEAVVLNCRIEEKLYPQSANSHDYFVRSYLKDRGSRLNSCSAYSKPASQENCTAAAASSQIESSLPRTVGGRKDSAVDLYEREIVRQHHHEEQHQSDNQDEDEDSRKKEGRIRQRERNSNEYEGNPSAATLRESNCVPTIKKRSVRHSEGHSSEISASDGALNRDIGDSEATSNLALPKNHQDGCKRQQSDVHWRRRIAETLKPC
ncbi:hypothetical protein DMN91_007603 [Ooceraea biroi]|uniref:Zinc finger protein n=2 Tax=Ooceraea biroi TaxID=2015173 RepID=A0A3L8DKP0_OOCBI|nr:hypothetical protein DMN91_007603 [Ooceraea biroi]